MLWFGKGAIDAIIFRRNRTVARITYRRPDLGNGEIDAIIFRRNRTAACISHSRPNLGKG